MEFTIKNRTQQSAYHFLRGVFGDDEIGKIELPKPYHPNFLLKVLHFFTNSLNNIR